MSETVASVFNKDNSPITNTNTLLKLASCLGSEVTGISLGMTVNSQFSIELFSTFLKSCPNCQTLDFSFCDLTDADLKQIATACKSFASGQLEKIVLHSMPRITLTGVSHFNGIEPIKQLSLQHNVLISQLPPHSHLSFAIQLKPWTEYGGY